MADFIPVHVRCPQCGVTWLEALIDPTSWWGKRVTPEQCAAMIYCPHCSTPPPMIVVAGEQTPQQGELFS